MSRLRSFAPALVCLLVWLLLAGIAPSAEALGGVADEPGSSLLDAFGADRRGKDLTGDGLSGTTQLTEDPVGSAARRGFTPNGSVAFAFQTDCSNPANAGHWICTGGDPGGGTPTATATPTPTATPSPTPDPILYEQAAFDKAHSQAVDWINAQLHGFDTAPPPRGQVVHLRNFMWIVGDTAPKTFSEVDHGIEVTVTATPKHSVWLLEELLSGRTFEYVCAGLGHPYADNPDETSTCGHTFDHSSSEVGEVALTVAAVYELTVTSTLVDARSIDGDTVPPGLPNTISFDDDNDAVSEPFQFPLAVHEVLTWGIDEDAAFTAPDYDTGPIVPEEDGYDCGLGENIAYYGTVGIPLRIAGVSCGEAFEVLSLLKDGAVACVGGIANSLSDTVSLLVGVVTDPVGTVKEGVAGIQALITMAQDDPVAFVTTVGFGVLGIDQAAWDAAAGDTTERALLAVSGICAVAAEIILGSAAKKILDLIPGRPGSTRPDPDAPDPDAPRRPRPCTISSFPTGTQVRTGAGALVPIEKIETGDHVLVADPTTGQWSAERVLAQWSYIDTDQMTTAVLADGSTITATDHHPFWVDSEQSWIDLEHVAAGDMLLAPTGPVLVADVVTHPQTQTLVWELDTAGTDTFTVHTGTTDLLVHNSDCGDAEVRDILDGRRDNPDPNVTKNTHGPAESVAAGVDADGLLISTTPKYNILGKKPKNGPGVDPDLADALRDTVRQNADGDFVIDSVEDYLDALDEVYNDLGNPLHDDVRDAIQDHIDANGGTIPNDPAGGFPGTHSEIQAANDLITQGVTPGDVSVGTIRTPDASDFPACNNCNPILDNLGITPVTD